MKVLENKRVYFEVIEEIYDKERRRNLIKIRCDCGNVAVKSKSHISKGCRTCGNSCPISKYLRSEAAKKNNLGGSNILEQGLSGMNRIYDLYKRRAKKKGFDFDITKDQFKSLTSSDCFYCGAEPSMVYMHKVKNISERERENSRYIYNSLDRIDPKLGYTLDNVRPSCKCCNIMKWNHEEDFFKERIKIFYNHYFSNSGDEYEDHY